MWPPTKDVKKASSFGLKDWIGVGLSLLAFLVSLSTAYFSVLREIEELGLVVADMPISSSVSPDEVEAKLKDTVRIIFINSGNRPVAVVKVSMLLVGSEGALNDKCRDKKITDVKNFNTTFVPKVVKEKEIVTTNINVTRSEDEVGDRSQDSHKLDRRLRKDVSVAACVVVHISTPGTAANVRIAKVASIDVVEGSVSWLSQSWGDAARPAEIWSSKGWAFLR